jgi:MFS family permease
LTKHPSAPQQRDFLWIVLFLVVFLNGFEAGGYQASLWNIGKDYDLSVTSMGLFASMELFATMLAPLLLGRWADRTSKDRSISILLGLQLAASALVLVTRQDELFLFSVFFLGLTTSALQFIAIAALADAYPVSNKRRIGFLTSMYATGALVAPLVVSFYLSRGMSWRTLFALLAAGSAVALVGILRSGSEPRENLSSAQEELRSSGRFVLPGVLLLCVIMCIYVGFENGFAFFVDTLFTDVLKSSTGKFALSLFWAVMIPSRVLVGLFSQHARKILIGSVVAIPLITSAVAMSHSSTPVLLLCVPLGFACGAIYPSVLTTLLPFAGKKTATATGMITTATGIGGVVFTALTGILADHLGLSFAMVVLSGFFVISFLCALGAQVLYGRIQRESEM